MKKVIIISLMIICILFTCCISNENGENKQKNEDGLYLHNDTYWHFQFYYTRSDWKNFTISDLEFIIIDNNAKILFSVKLSEAHPSVIQKGCSNLYPIPFNSSGVWDKETGNIITHDSDINDFTNCYLVYVDHNIDNNIGSGDLMFIYRDWDGDGEPDIKTDYVLNVYLKNELIVEEKLLQKEVKFYDGLK